jgi:hypothetical protein
MSAHTPGQFRVISAAGRVEVAYAYGDAYGTAKLGTTDRPYAYRMEVADFIVRACNAHEELLAALGACIDSQDCNGYIGVQTLAEARAVIAKVEDKE